MTQTRRRHHKPQSGTRKKGRGFNSGKKILMFNPSKTLRPGADFYKYVNQPWLNHVKIPPSKVVYSVSEEVEQREEDQMDILLQEWIKKSKQKKGNLTDLHGRYEHFLGTLAQSILTSQTQDKNKQFLQNILTSIQSLQSKEEVAVILGEFTRYKIPSLLTLYALYENKNDQRYSYTFGYGSLGLPDATYYSKRSMHRAELLEKYKSFLKDIGEAFQIPDLSCIVLLEKKLAKRMLKYSDDREVRVTGKQLEAQLPDIPLDIFFKTHGLDRWRDRIFFSDSLRWLHTVNHLFVHLQLATWRRILSAHILLHCLPMLPKPYCDMSFHFYKRLLRGQKQQISDKKRTILTLQRWTTPVFSRLYAENLVDPDVKPQVEHLLETLKEAAKKRLLQLDWMEPKTRTKAVQKVNAMRSIVAFPDSYEELTLPSVTPNDALLNLFIVGQWRTSLEIKKLGRTIAQRKDWEDPIYIVNAYYYPQANEIVIPSGILKYPFYDSSTPLGWNYGGIGCVLGHELTHAFDKEGKDYDPKGFLKKWWTLSDNRHYNEITKAIIKLYTKQIINGQHVAGKNTLSENISDIGGMAIALDALNGTLERLCKTAEEKKEAYRQFFMGYATSWRHKDIKKKRMQALFMDKHSPPFLRVNLVVSQFEEWYEAFDIKETDPMYIPPEKRISLF